MSSPEFAPTPPQPQQGGEWQPMQPPDRAQQEQEWQDGWQQAGENAQAVQTAETSSVESTDEARRREDEFRRRVQPGTYRPAGPANTEHTGNDGGQNEAPQFGASSKPGRVTQRTTHPSIEEESQDSMVQRAQRQQGENAVAEHASSLPAGTVDATRRERESRGRPQQGAHPYSPEPRGAHPYHHPEAAPASNVSETERDREEADRAKDHVLIYDGIIDDLSITDPSDARRQQAEERVNDLVRRAAKGDRDATQTLNGLQARIRERDEARKQSQETAGSYDERLAEKDRATVDTLRRVYQQVKETEGVDKAGQAVRDLAEHLIPGDKDADVRRRKFIIVAARFNRAGEGAGDEPPVAKLSGEWRKSRDEQRAESGREPWMDAVEKMSGAAEKAPAGASGEGSGGNGGEATPPAVGDEGGKESTPPNGAEAKNDAESGKEIVRFILIAAGINPEKAGGLDIKPEHIVALSELMRFFKDSGVDLSKFRPSAAEGGGGDTPPPTGPGNLREGEDGREEDADKAWQEAIDVNGRYERARKDFDKEMNDFAKLAARQMGKHHGDSQDGRFKRLLHPFQNHGSKKADREFQAAEQRWLAVQQRFLDSPAYQETHGSLGAGKVVNGEQVTRSFANYQRITKAVNRDALEERIDRYLVDNAEAATRGEGRKVYGMSLEDRRAARGGEKPTLKPSRIRRALGNVIYRGWLKRGGEGDDTSRAIAEVRTGKNPAERGGFKRLVSRVPAYGPAFLTGFGVSYGARAGLNALKWTSFGIAPGAINVAAAGAGYAIGDLSARGINRRYAGDVILARGGHVDIDNADESQRVYHSDRDNARYDVRNENFYGQPKSAELADVDQTEGVRQLRSEFIPANEIRRRRIAHKQAAAAGLGSAAGSILGHFVASGGHNAANTTPKPKTTTTTPPVNIHNTNVPIDPNGKYPWTVGYDMTHTNQGSWGSIHHTATYLNKHPKLLGSGWGTKQFPNGTIQLVRDGHPVGVALQTAFEYAQENLALAA